MAAMDPSAGVIDQGQQQIWEWKNLPITPDSLCVSVSRFSARVEREKSRVL